MANVPVDGPSTDLLQWVQNSPIGVGDTSRVDLVGYAEVALEVPIDPRLKKSRSRPNRGRMKRSDRLKPILTAPPWGLLQATGYPIPGDLHILQGEMPFYWRRGPRYLAWRAAVFAMWGTHCHLCTHGGADSADHLVPLAAWANQPYDARISRPAHGIKGCPTCHVKCNSSRGNKALAIQIGQYKPPVTL